MLGSLGALVLNLRDATGGLLLPLTAMQLLWINVITNGPPALALTFDQNQDLMQQPPRDPRSAILDTVSLRYIVIAGAISGLIGGLLLALFPRHGYSLEAARTVLFLYASISQLLLVYASRRIITLPRMNFVLHLAVLICLGVQLMTTIWPGLRALLGLEGLNVAELGWVVFAVAVSCGAAEVYSQMRLRPVNDADDSFMKPNLSFIKRIAVGIIGFTVILIGVALLVLPGPGLVTIALGLAILATEFVWARSWLQRAREEIERRNPLKRS